jgi:hypothetical protein
VVRSAMMNGKQVSEELDVMKYACDAVVMLDMRKNDGEDQLSEKTYI